MPHARAPAAFYAPVVGACPVGSFAVDIALAA